MHNSEALRPVLHDNKSGQCCMTTGEGDEPAPDSRIGRLGALGVLIALPHQLGWHGGRSGHSSALLLHRRLLGLLQL